MSKKRIFVWVIGLGLVAAVIAGGTWVYSEHFAFPHLAIHIPREPTSIDNVSWSEVIPDYNSLSGVDTISRHATEYVAEYGRQRAGAVSELAIGLSKEELNSEDVLELLDTIAPGSQLTVRRAAAERLVELAGSKDIDGDWGLAAAGEVQRLMTGDTDGVDPEERIAAMDELANGFREGSLEGGRTLELLDTIAPEASVKARAEAVKALATEYGNVEWDENTAMSFASDLHRVATGEELMDYETTVTATVSLANVMAKNMGAESVGDIDTSSRVVKEALLGTLTMESFGIEGQTRKPPVSDNELIVSRCRFSWSPCREWKYYYEVTGPHVAPYRKMRERGKNKADAYVYALSYVEALDHGRSVEYALMYAQEILESNPGLPYYGRGPESFWGIYVGEILRGKSEEYARAYARHYSSISLPGEYSREVLREIRHISAWRSLNVGGSDQKGIFEHLVIRCRRGGKSFRYSWYCAHAAYQHISVSSDLVGRFPVTEVYGYDGENIDWDYSRTYAELREEGFDHAYAVTFASASSHAQKHGFSAEWASAYAELRAAGRSHKEAWKLVK